MKKINLSLLLILICNTLYANHPLVRNFTKKDYKSGTQNWAIAQDEKNRMYFANNNGLLVFDGNKWITIPTNNNTSVRSLVYEKEGKIYASSFYDFGYYQQNAYGEYNFHSLLKSNDILTNSQNGLFTISKSDKKIFFQGDRSIYTYNGTTVSKIPFNYQIDASAVVQNIFFVACQQQGIFMLNGELFIRVQGSELLINKKVCSILPFKDKKILIITSLDGVYLYDGNSIEQYNTGIDDFLKANQVFCATTNGKQVVYGTIHNGIAIQNIEDKTVMYLNTFSGLQNNTILSATFDTNQNLWLGLDNGIDYVMLNSPALNFLESKNLYGSGYTSLLKNKVLYMGTNQGLYTTEFPFPISSKPVKLNMINGMGGQVWCLNDIDNTLFCGDDKGAYIVHPNKVDQIVGINGTWSFRQLKNHPDRILGCSYKGLFILRKNNGSWELSHFLKGNFNETSPMFEEDTNGTIWFSHWQKGLFQLHLNNSLDSITGVDLYDSKKGFPSNRNNTVFRIGNEIIFSSELGFYRYDKKMDKMISYEKWNKLFNTTPSFIRLHESKTGDVWCVSGKFFGLARKQKNNSYIMDSLSFRIVQPKLLIGFENFNFIDNNNLILNTEEGFSWINTEPINRLSHNFKVIINTVIATNKNNSNPETKHISGNTQIVESFKHQHNSIRLEFNAPEFRDEGLVQYSYKLENYDNTWSDFSPENIKEYNKLPRGTYTFKVIAHNMLEPTDATTSYTFTILPAWYESNLAFVIYAILLLILLISLVRFVNHRSKKGALEMEKLKEQEIQDQKKVFEEDSTAKKREIKELKNQQLQYELRHKSQELASSTMNIIRKNEILTEILDNITKTADELKKEGNLNQIVTRLSRMERNIKQNIENDNNWKKFEENFDLVYENYLKRLGDEYPELNVSDKKICAYIKMDLSSKDMAPLMNMSVRSIETNRYRLRKKLGLDREVNLSDFLQKF